MNTSPPPSGNAPPVSRQRPLLEVQGLTVDLGSVEHPVRIIDNVSFDIGRGEAMALVGESGSGKSMIALSLLRLLPRLTGRISSGTIRLDGEDLTGLPEREMRPVRGARIAMVFQDPLSSLNPVHRVGDQIAEMFRRHRGTPRKEAFARAVELLSRVGIPDAGQRAADYPFQFSGGMRQRVMIAMAMALEPELLIADEPTTALDATVQAQIISLLKDLQREHGMALLFISHDLGVVAQVAQNVGVLYAGRLAETGTVRQVLDRPSHPYTRGLLASIPPLDRRVDRLPTIGGMPPAPLTRVDGCAYRPRCPRAAEACLVAPDLMPVGDSGHASACHFHEAVAKEKEHA